MKKIQIIQRRSTINSTKKQKLIIKALGLGKINRMVEKKINPSIEGMVKKIIHLVEVKEIKQ